MAVLDINARGLAPARHGRTAVVAIVVDFPRVGYLFRVVGRLLILDGRVKACGCLVRKGALLGGHGLLGVEEVGPKGSVRISANALTKAAVLFVVGFALSGGIEDRPEPGTIELSDLFSLLDVVALHGHEGRDRPQ